MIIGIDNDKLQFIADSNGKLVVTLENLTDAIVKKELLQNCVITRCKDCKLSMSGIDKYNEQYILCQLHERSYGVTDDGFCNWAEREEE